jgi:hypothetical protein
MRWGERASRGGTYNQSYGCLGREIVIAFLSTIVNREMKERGD